MKIPHEITQMLCMNTCKFVSLLFFNVKLCAGDLNFVQVAFSMLPVLYECRHLFSGKFDTVPLTSIVRNFEVADRT